MIIVQKILKQSDSFENLRSTASYGGNPRTCTIHTDEFARTLYKIKASIKEMDRLAAKFGEANEPQAHQRKL